MKNAFRYVHMEEDQSRWGWKHSHSYDVLQDNIVIRVPGEMQLIVGEQYLYVGSAELREYNDQSPKPSDVKAWIRKKYYNNEVRE